MANFYKQGFEIIFEGKNSGIDTAFNLDSGAVLTIIPSQLRGLFDPAKIRPLKQTRAHFVTPACQ